MNNRKDAFWKVLACLFLIWAFVFLWSNSIKVYINKDFQVIKENRITGNSIFKVLHNGRWIKNSESNFMSIFDPALNYIISLIFLGSMIVLIIYTIKAIKNPSKKRNINE